MRPRRSPTLVLLEVVVGLAAVVSQQVYAVTLMRQNSTSLIPPKSISLVVSRGALARASESRLWFQCAAAILHQVEKGKTDRSSSAVLRSARGREGAKRAFDEEGGRKERDEMAEAIEAHGRFEVVRPRTPRPTHPLHPGREHGCSSVDAWHDFF